MSKEQTVPRQPDYICIENGPCDGPNDEISEVISDSVVQGSSVVGHGVDTTEGSGVIRDGTSPVSSQSENQDVDQMVRGRRQSELPTLSSAQKLNYHVSIQNELDVASHHMGLFAGALKSVVDVAESFTRSAHLSTEVVQKNFDALTAELAGNCELLLRSIERKRQSVVGKLEQRSGDIAKRKCQLERATAIAKKALSEEVMLVGQYDDVMQALRGATSRNCECLFRTPEPDPVRVAFDGDSLLILKSQIQRFSAVEGGTIDVSCTCKVATSSDPIRSPVPQSQVQRPSILLSASKKRLNSETNRPKSANKVVRISTDKTDSQEEAKDNHSATDEPIGHMTARKSTSGKSDIVLPKFRRFRPPQSRTSVTAPLTSSSSSASHMATPMDSQESSSQTESSRESSTDASANETAEMRSSSSPEDKSPRSPPPMKPADDVTETAESRNPRPARFKPPKFEPIPLRTRSSRAKQPARRRTGKPKPVEVTLRRLNLDNVISSRRRPAPVHTATEVRQAKLRRQSFQSSEDEDDEERQLRRVIALSAVEAQTPSKQLKEATTEREKDSDSDSDSDDGQTTGNEISVVSEKRTDNPAPPPPLPSNPVALNPPSNAKPKRPSSPEQPRRLLARKSAGPTVRPEEADAEISNIREVPIYHSCTETHGTFYVDRYYKPMHPCVLCLKCKETLATFQFATHSHSNDPKRCTTKKWRHCVRLKHPQNNAHQVIFQRLKERFGHKNPRGSMSKKSPDNSPSKELKKRKKKSVDTGSYLPYPTVVESTEDLTRFPRRVGQAYTGDPKGPRPKPGELVCVVPPVNEYDGQPWIGLNLRFTSADETEAELKWLRGTYSQPWSFEKRQRFMTGIVPLESVAFFGFTLRPNGRLYSETVEFIRHELEETEDSEQGKDNS